VVVPITYTVTPRQLTITAAAQNKVYDGTTAATVTLSDNRIAGDQLTLSYDLAVFADKNVGLGKQVTVSGITLSGPDAGNYTFDKTVVTTANITPRQLRITAKDQSKDPERKLLHPLRVSRSVVRGGGYRGSNAPVADTSRTRGSYSIPSSPTW
jgi:hypothetical protein